MSHHLHLNGKRRKSLIVNGVAIYYLLFTPLAFAAKSADIERNELPAPFNLQAVVLQKTITLTWQWPRPEELPVFTQFGYEVKRNDGKTFFGAETRLMSTPISPLAVIPTW